MEANNWPGGVVNLGNPDEHTVLRFAEIIRREAPLMGLRPKLEPPATDALTAASN